MILRKLVREWAMFPRSIFQGAYAGTLRLSPAKSQAQVTCSLACSIKPRTSVGIPTRGYRKRLQWLVQHQFDREPLCAQTDKAVELDEWPRVRPHVQRETENRMPSVFTTTPAPSAIPITFATKATWEAIAAGLPAQARQFAQANGFVAKPGACLTLPTADGTIAQ